MNHTDKNPDYREIYRVVRRMFEKSELFGFGLYDETYYTMRVYETAKVVMAKLRKPVKRQQVLVACILHDVGKTKLNMGRFQNPATKKEEWCRHPALGVSIAKRILNRLGHSSEFIAEVCYLVAHHDYAAMTESKSLELQVLQDADLLADCDLTGFARPFLYSARIRRNHINTIHHLRDMVPYVEQPGRLNLSVSKGLAKRKMRPYHELLAELLENLESDLLKDA